VVTTSILRNASEFHSEEENRSKDISDEVSIEQHSLCIKAPNIVRRATRIEMLLDIHIT
jgi:hypothetical protein